MLQVDLGPGVRAGFTTRHGGRSVGRFASANLSEMVGDDPAAVADNRARLARWAGAPVSWHHQVHGARVASADDPPTDADAVIGAAGQPVAVLVADCLPVLLADPVARVVAVAHAGRRGLVAGVLQTTVAAMRTRGAEPARIRAVVGPGICGRCYEVPATMRAEVGHAIPATVATDPVRDPALDLPAGAVSLLRAAGVGSVHDLGVCTAEEPRFFSHRGDRGADRPTGRTAGVVVADRPDSGRPGSDGPGGDQPGRARHG